MRAKWSAGIDVMRVSLLVGLASLAGPAEAASTDAAARTRILKVVPDGAPATGEGRFSTLAAALAKAAEWRRRDGSTIVVELESGLHRLDQPVRIGPELSGTADRPLVIRGAADGSSRLTGSRALRSASLPQDLLARLPPAVRDKVRAYRLPDRIAGEPQFREPKMLNDPAPLVTEVFDGIGALQPARWPNQGYADVVLGGRSDRTGFVFKAPSGCAWDQEPELWAEGFWQWDWLLETIPVERAGPRGGRIGLAKIPYEGERPGGRAALLHALCELDAPGEWWRDRKRGLLLVWPREGKVDLEIGLAETLLRIENARHLRVENLQFERARRDLVTVTGGSDITISRSTFAWGAGRAAVFENVAGGGITESVIRDIGATAVRLSGGDRVRLLPSGLFLRNTQLTRFARLSQTQNPAVQAEGVGVQVTGNLFHDAIGYAIHFRGNDHLFARNEVARLMNGLSDSGAIYAGRDWTARGTSIRDNYVHDIEPAPGFEVKGVYLDDMASGFTVERNLFVNVQKPVFIGGGSDNIVSDNVFVNSSPAISLDSRGQTWMEGAVNDPQSEIRTAYAAMPVTSPRWRERFPRLAPLLTNEPTVARDNQIVGNVSLNSRPLFTEQEADPRRQTIMLNSEATQPDLTRAVTGDPRALAAFLKARGVSVPLSIEAMARASGPTQPSQPTRD